MMGREGRGCAGKWITAVVSLIQDMMNANASLAFVLVDRRQELHVASDDFKGKKNLKKRGKMWPSSKIRC